MCRCSGEMVLETSEGDSLCWSLEVQPEIHCVLSTIIRPADALSICSLRCSSIAFESGSLECFGSLVWLWEFLDIEPSCGYLSMWNFGLLYRRGEELLCDNEASILNGMLDLGANGVEGIMMTTLAI
ncbi:hypothetical protein B0H10DRAFT_1955746 [Mycena sp. CBHHK59/15]|nr:hypothetical protein B0H10DRAFT_1955746 [Mycena sp. CBHHK59/15]